jgi:signal transduction histidine kinase
MGSINLFNERNGDLSLSVYNYIFYADVIFGSYTAIQGILALVAYFLGKTSLLSVVVIMAFVAINIAISIVSKILRDSLKVEFFRIVVGTVIAPGVYLLSDGSFQFWWPSFLIMSIGANLSFGLARNKLVLARIFTIYYALLLLGTSLVKPPEDWFSFSVVAGAIVMASLIISEIISLLSRTLRKQESQQKEIYELAQKLKESNNIKSKLISIIAHDVRGPLNSIKGLIQILSSGAISKNEFTRHSNLLETTLEGAYNLLENLLCWSEGQIEQRVVQLQRVEVKAAVGEAISVNIVGAERKNI